MKFNPLKLHTLVMIYSIVVIVAVLTWFLPGGEYTRENKNGRTQVVPNSFKYTPNQPQTVGDALIAPLKGFSKAAQIIVFVFLIGGTFKVIEKTGAINSSVEKAAYFFANNKKMQKFFIPVSMIVFSFGGAVFGMSEETMPFVLIFIPLAIALGYDSLVGTAIPFLGAAAGFAGALFNPFTVGIAQGIAELPLYSGLEYRVLIWFLSTGIMVFFVSRYAAKIKKTPELSPVYELDKGRNINVNVSDPVNLTAQHKMIMIVFGLSLVVLVYGILKFEWYINEIAALFFALGIISGLLGKLNTHNIAEGFKEGARDMMGVAMIIACARGILIIAEDGKILDLMLYSLSGVIAHMHPVFAAQSMFVTHGIINFFLHSGSAQAALTMPIMSPLADITGITRQTAVLAFQFGDGWINPILPTSGVTMGVLGLAGISWNTWFKWLIPVQTLFFILALLLLVPPVVLFFYGPF